MKNEYKREYGKWTIYFNVPVVQKEVSWTYTTSIEYEEKLLCIFHQHREMTEEQLFDMVFDKGYRLHQKIKIYEIMGL